MINLPTLLGAMLESIATDCATFTLKYLESFDNFQLNNLLNLHFSLPLEMAGSCVQFILPFDRVQSTKQFKLDDFSHCAQSALKELLFAHPGRIDRVKEKVDKYLQDIPIDRSQTERSFP